MSYIKKFVDKIAVMEGRQAREVVLPMPDAKLLRDEVLKILLDQREQTSKQPEVIEVVMNGNKW
jgi:hypothetical protein